MRIGQLVKHADLQAGCVGLVKCAKQAGGAPNKRALVRTLEAGDLPGDDALHVLLELEEDRVAVCRGPSDLV